MKILMKQSCDTREGDKEKNTPLHLAAKNGRAKNLEILLSDPKYYNINSKNKEGNLAIHLAAVYFFNILKDFI